MPARPDRSDRSAARDELPTVRACYRSMRKEDLILLREALAIDLREAMGGEDARGCAAPSLRVVTFCQARIDLIGEVLREKMRRERQREKRRAQQNARSG